MNELLFEARLAARAYRQGDALVQALAPVSCSVAPGDRIALVGRSGSGKSTLLHIMAGLDSPTSGAAAWPALGRRDALRPDKIGCVFQTPSLVPALSVIENVSLPLILSASRRGAHQIEARQRALSALALLDLTDLADKLPEEISGGQSQRVAVARALVTRPRLILADEPTGQLDIATASRLIDTLIVALTGGDTALIVATHDETIASRMSTIWRIDRGHLDTRPDKGAAA